METADFDTVSRGGNVVRLRLDQPPARDAHRSGAAPAGEDGGAVPHACHPAARGLLLVLLGVSVILWNPNRHVILSSGLCLIIGVGFYACVLGCKALGDAD